ncbi:kinase-like domain-containing protein [Hyaloraphidium curvatum]|nr:kinase-like domain-containing protein [Hyaloraphidium curvatum]
MAASRGASAASLGVAGDYFSRPPTVPTSPLATPSALQASFGLATPSVATPGGSLRKRSPADFDFGDSIGDGAYSTVVRARDRETGREFAAKILDKRHIIKNRKVKYVNVEKAVLNVLGGHPFVVKLYYTFQDETSLYFILDLAENGDMLGFLKKFGTFHFDVARFYAAELVEAIEYMHSKGVIHRDLKPENILLDDHMHIKVTDFGTAKMEAAEPPPNPSEQRSNSFVGTAEYVPPELLNERSASPASDLWSLGCVIYQLLAGRPPFKAGNEYQTFQKILRMEYAIPDLFPPDAADLVRKLLVEEPDARLGAPSEAGGGWPALKAHPFFNGISWGHLDTAEPPPVRSGIPVQAPPSRSGRSSAGGTEVSTPEAANGMIDLGNLERMLDNMGPHEGVGTGADPLQNGSVSAPHSAIPAAAPILAAAPGALGVVVAAASEPNLVNQLAIHEEATPRSASLHNLGSTAPNPEGDSVATVPLRRPIPPRTDTSRPLTVPNNLQPLAVGPRVASRGASAPLGATATQSLGRSGLPQSAAAVPDPLASQRNPASPLFMFTLALDPGESIVKVSHNTVRRRTFFGMVSSATRPLVLTDRPRLLAFQPDNHRKVKEQLDLAQDGVWCELVDRTRFVVHVPRGGDWVMEDQSGGAQEWVDVLRRTKADAGCGI